MVTSFYIMKMVKSKRNVDIDEYFNNVSGSISKRNLNKSSNNDSKCRVCLNDGTISIYDNENSNIVEALRIFGDIHVVKDDNCPKYLCYVCHKFLKGATLFRKTAKQTDDLLKQIIKEESSQFEESDSHSFSENDDSKDFIIENDSQKWSNGDTQELNRIKVEKKEKLKLSSKVTCHVCSKVINRSYYKEHMTMHDPDHQKYVCDVCGKSFRLRCAYHNHSLRHRNDFPYKCQFCPYRGRYSELLKTHMRTHTGDYRYMCTECPARFLFKSNLNSHMLKHKEPQFKCDSCKRAFHTKLTLQRHFESDHLGIKNHVCNLCGKAFGYRNAMMKHQRRVHKREKISFGRMPSYLQAQNRDGMKNND